MLPKNKDKLRREIDTIYERDHAVRVTLSPREIAYVRKGIRKRRQFEPDTRCTRLYEDKDESDLRVHALYLPEVILRVHRYT